MALTDAFASSYVAVEQWNPQRYYFETGVPASTLPTGTTGAAGGQGTAMPPGATTMAPAPLPIYVVIAALVILIWALERHKVRIFGQFRGAAGASA